MTMQNKTTPKSNGDYFLQTSQVTRHFLGYHGANDMHIPQMNVSTHDLYDTYLPAYEEFQTRGQAEGIMCSYASVNGIPSCARYTDVLTCMVDDILTACVFI